MSCNLDENYGYVLASKGGILLGPKTDAGKDEMI
jgi:hypothetical protein